MAGVMEIGSTGLAIRGISADRSPLGSLANLSPSFLRLSSRSQPRRDLAEFRSSRAEGGPVRCALNQETLSSSRGSYEYNAGQSKAASNVRRKTKIVCTIGPSTNTREMIWKLAEAGMNVAWLNMSHGDHASHQKVIDLVKEYNAQAKDNIIAIMLDTKGPEVRSGDLPKPIMLKEGEMFNFTIKRGVSLEDTVSVNYDDFIHDVDVGDILLVDGGMMSLAVRSKIADTVKCEVIDGGELKSRRHLNVRGISATLPSITDKDWEDIKFGVENKVDFYAVSFVKDAKAMVARGDLGAELPIEEVPLLQDDIIKRCRSMQKPVIVATNMLESMIDHPTPTRAEASDISVAVREGADGIMLSGETANDKYPLKAVNVMHTVALRTETTISGSITHPILSSTVQAIYGGEVCQSHMSAMFASHAATMANILSTPIIVLTKTGSMAVRLSHCRPSSTIFAFTNEERVEQRQALYRGVLPIHMPCSNDAEETFNRAINHLLKGKFLKEGEYVILVQSGTHSIWRQESTHHIQVRKVQI